ncbi:MAG: hypothetical protein ACT4OX_13965 [Actinomycetota bacterium]
MRSRRLSSSDLKVMLGATVAVLLAGLFIAGALIMTTSGDESSCGRLTIGDADQIRADVERSPFYVTGGGRCDTWIALDEGDLVAYRFDQRDGCQLDYDDGFRCVDGAEVDVATLDQYPLSIVTRDDVDTVVVDLGPTR